MVNSRAKGARAERSWAKKCREEGFESARRGRQYAGHEDAPDVRCDDLPMMHFEVKHVEKLNVQNAIDQACRDCGEKIPVVAHKKNHSGWLVTMKAEDWFKLVREYIP